MNITIFIIAACLESFHLLLDTWHLGSKLYVLYVRTTRMRDFYRGNQTICQCFCSLYDGGEQPLIIARYVCSCVPKAIRNAEARKRKIMRPTVLRETPEFELWKQCNARISHV